MFVNTSASTQQHNSRFFLFRLGRRLQCALGDEGWWGIGGNQWQSAQEQVNAAAAAAVDGLSWRVVIKQ